MSRSQLSRRESICLQASESAADMSNVPAITGGVTDRGWRPGWGTRRLSHWLLRQNAAEMPRWGLG